MSCGGHWISIKLAAIDVAARRKAPGVGFAGHPEDLRRYAAMLVAAADEMDRMTEAVASRFRRGSVVGGENEEKP